jgi:hypothetical protein
MTIKLLTVTILIVCFTFIEVDAYSNRKISLKGAEDEDKLKDTREVEGFWTRHLSASMSMGKKGLFVDRRHRHVKVKEAQNHNEVEGFWTRHLSASMSMGKKGLFVDRRHRHVKVEQAQNHDTLSLTDGKNYSITRALRGRLASPRKLPVFSEISDTVNQGVAMKEEAYFWQRNQGRSHSLSMSYN